MRAYVVAERYGVRSAAWEQIGEPAPDAASVVVKVNAAALAWSDVLQIEGKYAGTVPDLPFIAGHEFAGEVVAAPPGIKFRVGDRVFGFQSTPGAFAEYLMAPLSAIRATPSTLSDVDAAAFTTSFLTADAALFVVGGLRAGGSVLIQAAGGGVGRSAVQLAVASDVAIILATAGSVERRAAVIDLGATAAAGYDEFPALVHERTGGTGVDVVLESVGGDVFDRSARVLAPLGRLVTIGASSGAPPRRLKLPLLWQRSMAVCGLHIGRLLAESPDLLQPSWDRLLRLLDQGHITPEVGMVVSPTDLEKGMEALRSRKVDGRVVVDFNDPA